MHSVEKQANGKSKKSCVVNTKLLPFKFHFFFAFGGFAAVMPFMPIIGKHLGISATSVGFVYALIPFFAFLSNPIIGYLVDYFQNIKIFLITLLIIIAISFSSVMSLPPIVDENQNVAYIQVSGFNDSEPSVKFSNSFQKSCLYKTLKNCAVCTLDREKLHRSNGSLSGNSVEFETITYNISMFEHEGTITGNESIFTFYTKDFILPLTRNNITSQNIVQCSPDIYECSMNNQSSLSVYSTYQFWVFFVLAITGTVAALSSNSLSIAAAYELLGPQEEIYGRQRLFGTIGWGIICPLSGFLIDIQPQKTFMCGIYLMSTFLLIDIIILCFTSIPKAHRSSDATKHICSVFGSKDIVVFSFGIVVVGILNAVIAGFEFWFLEDMGATRTLLGMSVFMQCLVGEVPFLFFSGWLVKKLGHFLSFACSFGCFLIRFGLYSLLKNPWLVLPVDILHGVTFGLFHVAMTSFAKERAPKGMETTLLGIFTGLYNGLGNGIGSFLGGIGLDKLGPKQTFYSASMVSLGGFLTFFVATFLFKTVPESKKENDQESHL